MWERACSRRRRVSRYQCLLTDRFREQARSHRVLWRVGLLEVDLRVVLTTERADRITLDTFACQRKRRRVSQWQPQRLLLDLRLGLFVEPVSYTHLTLPTTPYV